VILSCSFLRLTWKVCQSFVTRWQNQEISRVLTYCTNTTRSIIHLVVSNLALDFVVFWTARHYPMTKTLFSLAKTTFRNFWPRDMYVSHILSGSGWRRMFSRISNIHQKLLSTRCTGQCSTCTMYNVHTMKNPPKRFNSIQRGQGHFVLAFWNFWRRLKSLIKHNFKLRHPEEGLDIFYDFLMH
jgi:hypothetical protein